MSDQPFLGKTIAIPESRMLDILANLFEQRGAKTIRCPLVAIHDSPNTEQIDQWMEAFIQNPPERFIIFTGEGIRRLLARAEKLGLTEPFIAAIAETNTLARGPKPTAALRSISLKPTSNAEHPSTEGIIASLQNSDLNNQRVTVQLYGEEPNLKLMGFLTDKGAIIDTVAPYIYASDSEQKQVHTLIDTLIKQDVDAMVFTSMAQLNRLLKISTKLNTDQPLIQALNAIKIAAVGPVIGSALEAAGIHVDFMPESKFFMKPMVAEMAKSWL